MTAAPGRLPPPPIVETADKEVRRLGIELELIGPDIGDLSRAVAEEIGGTVRKVSRYEHVVEGDAAGDWRVELDFSWLVEKGRGAEEGEGSFELIGELAERTLRLGAEHIVPFEIVTPPLPMTRLDHVQSLVARLRDLGAQGTRRGLIYAFGLQLNPELPALDAATIARYVKAFACLYDWLEKRAVVDSTRRLAQYIAPYPRNYVRSVIDPDYWPARDAFIDDYLEANPTRNRALDLLPLFLHLEPERVRRVVDDERVKARPALHYRLPNCEIDREDWSVDAAWADWLEVERLVAEPEALDTLCRRYAEYLDRPLMNLLKRWDEEVDAWLEARRAP